MVLNMLLFWSTEPSSEYVISLRAYNNIGEGRPIYETVFSREETSKYMFIYRCLMRFILYIWQVDSFKGV